MCWPYKNRLVVISPFSNGAWKSLLPDSRRQGRFDWKQRVDFQLCDTVIRVRWNWLPLVFGITNWTIVQYIIVWFWYLQNGQCIFLPFTIFSILSSSSSSSSPSSSSASSSASSSSAAGAAAAAAAAASFVSSYLDQNEIQPSRVCLHSLLLEYIWMYYMRIVQWETFPTLAYYWFMC